MAKCLCENFIFTVIMISNLQPHVRREACVGLYRLCLGKTAEGKTGYPFLLPILSSLLSFMTDAFKIKPQKNLDVSVSALNKGLNITTTCVVHDGPEIEVKK